MDNNKVTEDKSLQDIYTEFRDSQRRKNYLMYEELFEGNHFGAFSIQAKEVTESYARLRYVVCNFAGLISKVAADFLFGEPPTITDENSENQKFIEALRFENSLDILNYESAISNSYFGDSLFKLRVEESKLLLEDTPAVMYFPELDSRNNRAEPKKINLVWLKTYKGDGYLFVETHDRVAGEIRLRVGKINKKSKGSSGGESVIEFGVENWNKTSGDNLLEVTKTGIDRFLIKHVPNPKARGHFGLSDYIDIAPLLFSLNNRMTKIDNVLDKHSDPILAVPPGVLDEKGNVRKEAFTMFEFDPDTGAKPEYIVWNANLDVAFKQIDKLVEFMYMFSETSPEVMGMGKGGQAESGRALKMKLLRTIAKRNRKKLYYDKGVKDVIYTAELLAKEHKLEVMGVKPGTPALPDIKWEDGVVNDEFERTQIATMKIEADIKSRKDAIMELEGVDEEEAKARIEEIDSEGGDFTSFMDADEKVRQGNQNGEQNRNNATQ